MTPLVHYWHESRLPDHVAAGLASYREHNPELEQVVFDESSAERFIAASFGDREAAAFRACAVPAMQADYLRYCAVCAFGGIYADANSHCLRDLKRLIDGPEKGIVFGRQDPLPRELAALYKWPHAVGEFRVVTNGLFGFAASGHPLLSLAVKIATANIEARVADGPMAVWVTTGPGVLTSLYLLHQLGSIDAFVEYSIGTVIESSAPLLCEIIDDFARAVAAWREIGIWPLRERDGWAVKTSWQRERSTHWLTAPGDIYG